ncbi:MAG: tail fiber domain-containing protein, partial [Candidatus Paceibacterota bacterium]
NQGEKSVAIGSLAGQTNQGENSVAIGSSAGQNNQSTDSVAIGIESGFTGQGNQTTAIGCKSGRSDQGLNATSVGVSAGYEKQGEGCVALGGGAGYRNQEPYAIAIGVAAGSDNQGRNAIAIGHVAGNVSQAPNSIVLNASGVTLAGSSSGFFVRPISIGGATNVLHYNTSTFELTYVSSSETTKNTIKDLNIDTTIVADLKPKTYIYNNAEDAGEQIGYIAEEVAELNSHFATYETMEGEPKNINWNVITVFLVEELKKLKLRVSELEETRTAP